MNPLRRRAAVVLAAPILLGGLVGCGVQLDDDPRELARYTLPFDLLATSTTGPPTTATPLPTFQETSVYLVDNDDYLIEVKRQLPGEVRVAVGSLLTPPTEAEVNSGLSTDIAPSVSLRGIQAREVPTGEGQSTAEPLSRVDYRQFLRPPTRTTAPDATPES